MFKFLLIAFLGLMVSLAPCAQLCSGEDLEDRFIDGDLSTSTSIFIDVKNVSLDNVLKIISQQSGLSFIASQDVADKKITIYLNKIPLSLALQTVLDANGLTYEMQGDSNVFFVKAKETTAKNLITRVYQLKYASVSSSKLNSTISISSPSSSSFGAGSSSSSGEGSSSSTTTTGSSTTSSGGSSSGGGTSDTAGGLELVIKDALSPDGKVEEDTRTNSLIITDVPAQFPSIENAIAKLDVPIPQILIEVEMIEVSKATADQLGVTYGATPLTFTGGSRFENWPFGNTTGAPSSSSSSSGTSSSSTSSSSSSSSSSSGSTPTTGWNANGLTATLNFLSSTTDSKTLARPKILTLNNETAQIQISTDAVINFQQTTSSSSSSSTQVAYTPVRATTGVILTVTPQANLLTREITLAVSPRDIDIVLSQVQPPLSAGLGTSYDTQTRGSDSILKLKDGQSMMIGGLMDNQDSNSVTKLPFLGDLPLIGAAFRSKSTTKNDRELIIFLTPHIIDDSNQSGLKSDNSDSAQAELDMQDASDRLDNINSSLNSYEMKKY